MTSNVRNIIGLKLIALGLTIVGLAELLWAAATFGLITDQVAILSVTQWANPVGYLAGLIGSILLINLIKTILPTIGFGLMLLPELYFLMWGIGLLPADQTIYHIMMTLPLAGTILFTVATGLNSHLENKWLMILGLSLLTLRWVFYTLHMYLQVVQSSYMNWELSTFFDTWLPLIIWLPTIAGSWMMCPRQRVKPTGLSRAEIIDSDIIG